MTTTLTREDLKQWYYSVKHFKRGYCCQYDSANYDKLIEIGSNAGYYGWNWSIFLDPLTSTLYCSNYRNVPDYLIEK